MRPATGPIHPVSCGSPEAEYRLHFRDGRCGPAASGWHRLRVHPETAAPAGNPAAGSRHGGLPRHGAAKASPRQYESYAHEDGIPIGLFDARQPRHKPMHGKCGRDKNAEFLVIGGRWRHFVQPELYRLHGCCHRLSQPASGRRHRRLPAAALEERCLQPLLQRAKLLGNCAFGDVQLRSRDFPRSEAGQRLEIGEHPQWRPAILNDIRPPLWVRAGNFWPRFADKKSLRTSGQHSAHVWARKAQEEHHAG